MKTVFPSANLSISDADARCCVRLLDLQQQHSVTDLELLSVLFSMFSSEEEDSNELAQTALKSFGSLGQIVKASAHELHDVLAQNQLLVQCIGIVRFILDRIVSEKTSKQIRINSPNALIEYVTLHKNLASSGYRRTVFLDRDMRLIRDQSMSIWQTELNACRDIAQVALRIDAFGLIVIDYAYKENIQPHHKSISFNQIIEKSMLGINIQLIDQITVGINQFYSFKQKKIIDF